MPNQTDLFTFAGLDLDDKSNGKPGRVRKPRPPSPAERAATGRLEGARRSRPALRDRVGPPRQLGAGDVVAFPLSRNAGFLNSIVEKLPSGLTRELEVKRRDEARKLEKRLIHKGIGKKSARICANETLHRAYMVRANEANKEM